MSVTADLLVEWLEEDGHPGCAQDLLAAPESARPAAARNAADCAESDPDAYDDDSARALPGILRDWADTREAI